MDKTDIIFKNQYPVWIKYLHPDYMKHGPEIIGKWVHHDKPERLEIIAQDFTQFIVEELSYELKYRPVLNDPRGPFAHMLPPLCIYSTPENKDVLYDRIKKYGLPDIYWQSNEATRELHARIRQSRQSN